jgi:septal ring factor EnvC (AmiA/AmiB activator)
MAEGSDRSRALEDDAARLRARYQDLADRRAQLRSALERTAVDLARTETTIADTLDEVAALRPDDADRLHGRAQAARDFAEREVAFGAEGESGGRSDRPPGRDDS